MKVLLMILSVTFFLQGCVTTDAVKDKVGKAYDSALEVSETGICGGSVSHASLERRYFKSYERCVEYFQFCKPDNVLKCDDSHLKALER